MIKVVRLESPKQVEIIEDELVDVLRDYARHCVCNADDLVASARPLLDAGTEFGVWVALNGSGAVVGVAFTERDRAMLGGVIPSDERILLYLLETDSRKGDQALAISRAILEGISEWEGHHIPIEYVASPNSAGDRAARRERKRFGSRAVVYKIVLRVGGDDRHNGKTDPIRVAEDAEVVSTKKRRSEE